MTRGRWKDLFEVIGVTAIVISLVFLTLEMRANTATRKIIATAQTASISKIRLMTYS